MKADGKQKEIASATLRITRITTSYNDDTDDNLSNLDEKMIRGRCTNSKYNLKSTISKFTNDPRSKITLTIVKFNCTSDNSSDGLDIEDEFNSDINSTYTFKSEKLRKVYENDILDTISDECFLEAIERRQRARQPPTYEDNLSKEIEDIISQIYEFHLSDSKSFDIYSYEKQVNITIKR